MKDYEYYDGLVKRVFALGDRLLSAADLALHVSIVVFNDKRQILAGMSTWAGIGHKPDSRGYLFGPSKASELILSELSDSLTVTPTGGFLFGSGYMGGVRKPVDDVYFVAACSGWSQEADLVFALLLLYAMENEVAFHHVGFGYEDEEELTRVVSADIVRFQSPVLVKPATDHQRYYVSVKASELGNGKYYREHQIGGPVKPNNIHWDVVVQDPKRFLEFISSYTGDLDHWGYSPNSPEGAVWVDNRGQPFGIMARREWWAIQ